MNIQFTPIDDPLSDDVFNLLKAGLFAYVDRVFGWYDDDQRQRLRDEYQPEWFQWVLVDGNKVGFVCFRTYQQALHLHLIVLDASYQGRGLGKQVMAAIHAMAVSQHQDVTLSCFKCNERALALYHSLGYSTTDEDDYFLSLRWHHRAELSDTGAA
ncbi:GNAT family N-acetyltransferase [Bacterioplanes sanyensis]|uniref:GNAT family N-acetyltransferase n=1 Tax=Bacterioplanes sanyensis TaxID=1249553 RepID=UPI0018EEAE6C|nr:GNAT family N-acetyltransferase [Bacterioplanes sanyensis]